MTKEEAIEDNKKWLASLTPARIVKYIRAQFEIPGDVKMSAKTRAENFELMSRLKAHLEGCKSCWWQEGGRCYLEPCNRLPNGRSEKLATGICEQYKSKREALSAVIPNEMLYLASERFAEPPKEAKENDK